MAASEPTTSSSSSSTTKYGMFRRVVEGMVEKKSETYIDDILKHGDYWIIFQFTGHDVAYGEGSSLNAFIYGALDIWKDTCGILEKYGMAADGDLMVGYSLLRRLQYFTQGIEKIDSKLNESGKMDIGCAKYVYASIAKGLKALQANLPRAGDWSIEIKTEGLDDRAHNKICYGLSYILNSVCDLLDPEAGIDFPSEKADPLVSALKVKEYPGSLMQHIIEFMASRPTLQQVIVSKNLLTSFMNLDQAKSKDMMVFLPLFEELKEKLASVSNSASPETIYDAFPSQMADALKPPPTAPPMPTFSLWKTEPLNGTTKTPDVVEEDDEE